MITKGRNCGRIGTLMNKEKHPGSFNIAHIKDAGNTFGTSTTLPHRNTTADGSFEFMIDMGRLTGKKLTIIRSNRRP